MHVCFLPLLFALGLSGIRASGIPQPPQLPFFLLPIEIRNDIFGNTDLVAYDTVLRATGGAPLVTLEVEERLLSRAAEEVKHLDISNDDQRARLSAILDATRAVVGRRSALPKIIDPDTDADILKQRAAQFESNFYEYSSRSSSPTWAKYCMAALHGKNTLVGLLPSLSESFVKSHMRSMLQAAAVVADFDTLRAVAENSRLPHDKLRSYIKDDALFSGKVEFVQKIVEFVPEFIQDCSVLETAIKLNHLPLFNYLYAETVKQKDQQETLHDGIARALEALAGRGWEHEFKQLHQDHPQMLDAKKCLRSAAKHGRIEILKYLLVDNGTLAEEARLHINTAFELAVGSGSIDAIDFLLGDERGNPLIPYLFLTQPTPAMLKAVGESGRWDGIEHLMLLRQEVDARFAQFRLGGDASEAVQTACEHGHLQVFEKLLQKDNGKFVFTFEDPRETFQKSLIAACENGRLPVVRELLRKDGRGNYVHQGIDPAAQANRALIGACSNGHLLVVQELLRKDENGNYVHQGIDPAAGNHWALIRACQEGHLPVVQELLRKDENGHYVHQGIDPAVDDNQALREACYYGRLPIVQELLRKNENGNYVHQGIDPAAENNEALIGACSNGHLLVIQELLRKDENGNYVHQGIDPAAENNWALIGACGSGHSLVVQELLRKDGNGHYFYPGIDPSAWNNQALRKACEKGHILVVQELLRKDGDGHYVHQGIDPAAENNEALRLACINRHILVVQELLRQDGGDRALIRACSQGHLPVVRELLRKDGNGRYVYPGIDPTSWNNQALRKACENGHLLVVQELLRKDKNGEYVHQGIDPAAENNEALRLACINRHILVVQELLRQDGGDRALIRACSQGHLPVVRELLRKDKKGHYVYQGIDPVSMNNAPLIEACGKGHLDIVKLLLQGRPNTRGVIEYEHDGIDAAAQDNMALLKAIEAQQTEIVEFLLQKTEEGEYIFPGIRVTNQVRRLAASKNNPKLNEFVEFLPGTMRCALL